MALRLFKLRKLRALRSYEHYAARLAKPTRSTPMLPNPHPLTYVLPHVGNKARPDPHDGACLNYKNMQGHEGIPGPTSPFTTNRIHDFCLAETPYGCPPMCPPPVTVSSPS